jgi:hypothetical protein
VTRGCRGALALLLLAPAAGAQSWTFTDVSVAAGLDYEHGYLVPLMAEDGSYDERRAVGGGVAAGDYDRDGWIDLFVVHGDVGPDLLLRNRGDGTFEEVGGNAGVGSVGRFGAGPTFADVDGDGWLDLFVGGVKETPLLFFRNRGDGTFEERSASLGLAITRETQSAAFGDYDRDGDLDLALTHWSQELTPGESTQTLWRNDGAAGFVDVSEASGIAPVLRSLFFDLSPSFGNDYSFTPNFVDLDDDGFPELLIACDFGTSRVFHNEGDGTFTDATNPAVITDENGMGAAIGDVDNDGRLDWFVSSIWDPDGVAEGRWGVTGNRLYRGLSGGAFEDVTESAGVRQGYWGWGATLGDLDNDGDLDLFHVNGWASSGDGDTGAFYMDASRLFIASPPGVFVERSVELGIVDTGQGRGVVSFDYDRDGDLDLFVANNVGPLRLFRNDGEHGGFLEITLLGRPPNTDAIGSYVWMTTAAGRQLRVVRAGSNFVSQDPTVVHVGLGTSPQADVEVRWPNGERLVVPGVATGTRLRLLEPGDVGSCADAATDNACVPARGSAKRACAAEWRVAPRPARTKALRTGRITCRDGDPTCDLDGDDGNAGCTFAVALCLENADPRFPRCDTTSVTGLEVTAPAAEDALRPAVDMLVADVPVTAGSPGRCSALHTLAVPLGVRPNGRPRAGKTTLQVTVERAGRTFTATLKLRCDPA